ncbi:MAG: hypothetical protein H6574_15250 [Lewinellaceae bacterium]|nr:hypothetical protein [Saprospiraceae bacterium]MCB9332436.1 hypothetical protein [Lewinellaceae bacterium]
MNSFAGRTHFLLLFLLLIGLLSIATIPVLCCTRAEIYDLIRQETTEFQGRKIAIGWKWTKCVNLPSVKKLIKTRHIQKRGAPASPEKGVKIALLIFFFLLLLLVCYGLVIWAVGGFLLDFAIMGVLAAIGALVCAYFAVKTLIKLIKTIKSAS